MKNHFISASSFCVVMKKAESVSTVLSLPYISTTGNYCNGQVLIYDTEYDQHEKSNEVNLVFRTKDSKVITKNILYI